MSASTLPTINKATKPEKPPNAMDPKPPGVPATAVNDSPSKAIEEVTVNLPMSAPDFVGYASNRIDVRLRGNEAKKLKRICLALENRDCKLADGKHVRNSGDAIRWILEQMPDE